MAVRLCLLFFAMFLIAVGGCDAPSANTPNTKSTASKTTTEANKPPLEVSKLKTLDEAELAEGWISLFDGQTLYGWKAANKADWRVENEAIVVSSGEQGLLHTTTQFADYQLNIEFRSAKGTNSGIFLRTPARPSDPAKDCYELNIADEGTNLFPTGGLVGRQKAKASKDSENWQKFEVTANGGHFTIKLDGEEVLDYTDPEPIQRGHIGLQLNTGKVEFRNIMLKPLGAKSIFNGRDLSGWKTYPDMKSKFTVTKEGWLNVRDGRGQLETEKSYGDFVLQLECITHAPRLNSGVFFRCIPGDVMMGYECQIQNGFKNGDRTQTEDCGTGGIFRRNNARAVLADDQKWFSLTLIADGAHMAAWVNGCQVSDWTDDRPPDENPRKGKRLAPGTIMIQGHDPTTNLSFRRLRIVASR